MCGIAGFIDKGLGRDSGMEQLSRMLETIGHRGPDSRGLWNEGPVYLGHNRLSIIDLSDNANQPFTDGDLHLVYNGEIYNYIELREELKALGQEFKTDSDTEVLIKSYRQWGVACVEHFVGMWAFALWDSGSGALFCSRDRFGIKPFCYIIDGERFCFSSEYKALKKTGPFSNDLNISQIYRGLQLGWLNYKDESYFNCIKVLPAAHNLLITKGRSKIWRYWDIDIKRKSSLGFEEKKEEFKRLFLQSIRQHSRSDVVLASCLSGGLDSSAIVSAAARLTPENIFKTFTIYYDGDGEVDEREFAKTVIKDNPNVEPYFYSPREDEIEEALHEVIHYFDVPISGSAPISRHFLMRMIREHDIKVVLDGQGSDEYLAGYRHTAPRYLADIMSRLELGKYLKTLSVIRQNEGLTSGSEMDIAVRSFLHFFLNEEQISNLEYNKGTFLPKKRKSVVELERHKGSRVDEFLYHLLFDTKLNSLLHTEDRNSMAYSIEARVPFLDHRLVEFSFTLSNDDRYHMGVSKFILRESLKELLPAKVYQRKDKKGFVTPGETKWLRGPLKHYLEEMKHANYDFLHMDRVRQLITEYERGSNKNVRLIWRLMTLHIWLEKNA